MCLAFRERSVERDRAVIYADAYPGLTKSELHIIFAHQENDHACLPVVRDQQVKQCINLILLAHHLCDLVDPLSLILCEVPVQYAGHQNAFTAAGPEIEVLPIVRRSAHLLLQLFTSGGILEPLDEFCGSAFVLPGRYCCAE